MSKEIIINVTGEHSRIAIVEDGELVELYFETPENARTIGDIFLGRVRRSCRASRPLSSTSARNRTPSSTSPTSRTTFLRPPRALRRQDPRLVQEAPQRRPPSRTSPAVRPRARNARGAARRPPPPATSSGPPRPSLLGAGRSRTTPPPMRRRTSRRRPLRAGEDQHETGAGQHEAGEDGEPPRRERPLRRPRREGPPRPARPPAAAGLRRAARPSPGHPPARRRRPAAAKGERGPRRTRSATGRRPPAVLPPRSPWRTGSRTGPCGRGPLSRRRADARRGTGRRSVRDDYRRHAAGNGAEGDRVSDGSWGPGGRSAAASPPTARSKRISGRKRRRKRNARPSVPREGSLPREEGVASFGAPEGDALQAPARGQPRGARARGFVRRVDGEAHAPA